MAIFAVHYRYADQPEAVAAAKPEHRTETTIRPWSPNLGPFGEN